MKTTHLVGSLQFDSVGLPKDLLFTTKQNQGQMTAVEIQDGFVVILSAKHKFDVDTGRQDKRRNNIF